MDRFIGIELRTLARSNVAALLDQGIVSLGGFVTTVLIARYCSQSELGIYTLGLSMMLIMIEVQTAVVATPYMIFSPRVQADERPHYNGSSLVVQLGLSTMAAAVIAILGVGLAPIDQFEKIGPVLLVLSCVAIPVLLREYIRRVCFARLNARSALVFDTFIVAMQVGGLIVVAEIGLLSAGWAFVVAGSSCAISALAWLFSRRHEFAFQASRLRSDFVRNWNIGKWVLASGAMWAIGMSLYPWLLAALHGTEAAGTWGVCMGVLALGTIPMIGIQNYLGPKISTVFATESDGEFREFLIKSAATFGGALIPVVLILALLGDWLISTIYTSKYSGNGAVVAVLAINLIVSAVAFCFSRALFVRERADLDCWINIIPIAILLTLGMWLTSTLGPLGAALSLLLANGVSAAARYVALTDILRAALRGS